jgi:hypothetical protein
MFRGVATRAKNVQYTEAMSERERLHEIVESLPVEQVRALLTILGSETETETEMAGQEQFLRQLAEAPAEEVDDKTIARILAAEGERGENIQHDELKRRLGI